jgi:hypothetical protein
VTTFITLLQVGEAATLEERVDTYVYYLNILNSYAVRIFGTGRIFMVDVLVVTLSHARQNMVH